MRILLLELWGLGDAVMMTAALRPLLKARASVTILCKAGSAELLRPSYPQATFLVFNAPWTAFSGKYRFARWPWRKLLGLIRSLRREKFDAAASVRNDPRDHLFMFLVGAKNRIGFPRGRSGIFLTEKLSVSAGRPHRVHSWQDIGQALMKQVGPNVPISPEPVSWKEAEPWLDREAYQKEHALDVAESEARTLPVLAVHCGASRAVRRWPEKYLETILRALRQEAAFHLALFPDLDGFGQSLRPLANSCHESVSISQMTAELAACDLLICNDSGPGHIAAAMGIPVLAVFGPGAYELFRPYGSRNQIVIRDICPFRPCFDSCHFAQPVCLTDLLPSEVEPEIRVWFRHQLEWLTLSHPMNRTV